MSENQTPWRQRRVLVALTLLIVLVIAGASTAYQIYARNVRFQTQALLLSIARARATAIRAHLDERIADGWVIARHTVTRQSLDTAVPLLTRQRARAELLSVMSDAARAYGYHNLILVDRDACRLYELFAARQTTGGAWQAGSGAIFDLDAARELTAERAAVLLCLGDALLNRFRITSSLTQVFC